MSLTLEFREEVERWVEKNLSLVPTGLMAQAHRAHEHGVPDPFDHNDTCPEVLELIASPTRECLNCGESFDLDDVEDWWIHFECEECGEQFTVSERNLKGNRHCPECGSTVVEEIEYDEDDERELTTPCCDHTLRICDLSIGRSEHAWPAAWGWMALVSNDEEWFKDHASEIGAIGFYVYNGMYGISLGIDAGGLDFYEAFWAPLYRLYRDFPEYYGVALRPYAGDLIARFAEDGKLAAILRVLAVSGDVLTVSRQLFGEQDWQGSAVREEDRVRLQGQGFRKIAEDENDEVAEVVATARADQD